MDGTVVTEENYIKEFVESIPNDIWIEIAITEWEELEKICVALTLDLYFIKNESTSNR